MAVLYDPPFGWCYGFPKPYKLLPNESLSATLLRDGYPQHEIDNGGAKYCRFIGERDELEAMAQRHIEGDNDNPPVAAQAQPAGFLASMTAEQREAALSYRGPENHGDAALDRRKGDYIQTFTGRKFWPLEPRPDEVCIDDIAHALSMLCRYNGHCLKFYSVAEHSVHVAQWLLDNGYPCETILAGLLHDATEAYVADVPRPLKQSLPTYKDAENKVWRAIAARYGLDAELPAEVHEADNRILSDEIQQNMKPMEWHAGHDDPLGVELEFWTPAQAEREFISMFRFLDQRRRESAMSEIEARHDREASRADWDYQFRKEQEAA